MAKHYVYRPRGTAKYAVGTDDGSGGTREVFGQYAELDLMAQCAEEYLDGTELQNVRDAITEYRASGGK